MENIDIRFAIFFFDFYIWWSTNLLKILIRILIQFQSTSDSVHWFCQFAASLRPALRSSSSESRRMALRLLSQLWTSNPENGGNDINAEDVWEFKKFLIKNFVILLINFYFI